MTSPLRREARYGRPPEVARRRPTATARRRPVRYSVRRSALPALVAVVPSRPVAPAADVLLVFYALSVICASGRSGSTWTATRTGTLSVTCGAIQGKRWASRWGRAVLPVAGSLVRVPLGGRAWFREPKSGVMVKMRCDRPVRC